jgi:hypothetical protein
MHHWLAQLGQSMERRYQPKPTDLANPAEVSPEAIVTNYLRDPTRWDDDAREALTPMIEAETLHSQDPIKRMSALLTRPQSIENPTDKELRLRDLLARRVDGFKVNFSFPVEVHHGPDGRLTAVDVRLAVHQQGLDRLIRISVEQALADAPLAPVDAMKGQPFVSHWVMTSTWFMDPPRLMFGSSDSFGQVPGGINLKLTSKFEVTKDGVVFQDLDVHQRVSVELRGVESLAPPIADGG